MADSAFQTQYRQEHIAKFERMQSVLREGVVTDFEDKGSAVVFLTAGSGNATAVTRGLNGKIPGRADDLTQLTCPVTEWHDKVIKSNYNIFASQGDQRSIMQQTTQSVINRKIDDQIITELATGTNNTGAAVPATLNLVTKAVVKLGNNNAGGRLFAAITPAFKGYMMQWEEFTNVQWTSVKPYDRDTNDNVMETFHWNGVQWVVHTGLPGISTAAEQCFMWNKRSIGHAAKTGSMQIEIDYNKEDDYSFARASMFMGAKLLQNSGVVIMNHDGTAFN